MPVKLSAPLRINTTQTTGLSVVACSALYERYFPELLLQGEAGSGYGEYYIYIV
ncbi:MAG: hypothetical protein KF862_25975 [Chitinophagaceae bacterium]|nr:hypothetical protein [Chitinophagaceae bacterium]